MHHHVFTRDLPVRTRRRLSVRTRRRLPGRPLNALALAAAVPLLAVAPIAGAGPAGAAPEALDLPTTRLATADIEVVPQAPVSHDGPGMANDTCTLPQQDGIEWWVEGARIDPSRYGTPILLGDGQYPATITFVAKPTSGYRIADGAETTFVWQRDVGAPSLAEPTVEAHIHDGWKATVSWDVDVPDVTYTVTYRPLIAAADGQSAGLERIWWQDTTRTSGEFSAGWGLAFRITVVATDSDGTVSEPGSVDVAFPAAPLSTVTDLTPATATLSAGWWPASGLSRERYYLGTALLTDRAGASATWSVRDTSTVTLRGTTYAYGGRALVQVDGRSWATVETRSPTPVYQAELRTLYLPDSGAHTIRVIALDAGRGLILDAFTTPTR